MLQLDLDNSSQSVIWGPLGGPQCQNSFPNINTVSAFFNFHECPVDFSGCSLTSDEFIALMPNGISAMYLRFLSFNTHTQELFKVPNNL